MEIARTALGDQVDGGSAIAAILGLIVIQQDFDFLHRIGVLAALKQLLTAEVGTLQTIYGDSHHLVGEAVGVGDSDEAGGCVGGAAVRRDAG